MPGRSRLEGRAACCLLAADGSVLRADEPRVHGLRALQGSSTRLVSPTLAPRCPCIPARRATATWATSLRGMLARARSSGRSKEQFSVWSGALTTAGGVAFYGTLEGYLKCRRSEGWQGAVQVPHSFGHHRQRVHLWARWQAVRRRLLGRWWLGWHRPRGWPDQPDRWSGCSRRLRWSATVHRTRWLAHGVLAALNRS